MIDQPSRSSDPTVWKPSGLDLVLSSVLAFGLPLLAGLLLKTLGALVPMVVYYGSAWGVCIWRRGTSGYSLRQVRRPPVSFWVHLAVIGLSLVFAWSARIVELNPDPIGVVFTAIVWTVANASSEQLLWIYLFDSWDLRSIGQNNTTKRLVMRLCGLLLFSAFAGLIHMTYWARFLHTVKADTPAGILFVLSTIVSGYLHIVVWRQSKNMLYTFIPHFILNFVPLLWTGYSILPYLVP